MKGDGDDDDGAEATVEIGGRIINMRRVYSVCGRNGAVRYEAIDDAKADDGKT
jgi:hypothetical protein